jgi:hypothetical protein
MSGSQFDDDGGTTNTIAASANLEGIEEELAGLKLQLTLVNTYISGSSEDSTFGQQQQALDQISAAFNSTGILSQLKGHVESLQIQTNLNLQGITTELNNLSEQLLQ